MKSQVKIYESEKFGIVRTAGTSEQPLFCLADVCKAVELTNPSSVKTRLDKEDVQLLDLHALNCSEGAGFGNTKATFVTESGLYDVILSSSSAKVKPFRKWVTHDVLPSIRRTGQYALPSYQIADPVERAERWIEEEKERQRLTLENKEQSERLKSAAPKVLFADAVVGSKSSCLIGELAKVLSQNGYTIGQNRLFEWLRKNGYLGAVGERRNIPNQRYVERGLFEIRKGVRTGSGGELHTTITTKVTGKGQQYFINLFLGGGHNQP